MFKGHLIATSAASARFIKEPAMCKKYFYINNYRDILSASDALYDNSIVKFARCHDYLHRLAADNISISPVVVEDFDVEAISRITV
jgi:hypothetical protein